MNDDASNRDPRRPATPFVPPKPRAEVDAELAYHLEQRIQKNIAGGMSPDAARHAALERFGDVAGVRETCERLLIEDRRATARRDWLDDLRLDTRFAIRSTLRAPLFSLLAICTLALGIGANAAVFGVVKSVLLNALPYSQPDRLMVSRQLRLIFVLISRPAISPSFFRSSGTSTRPDRIASRGDRTVSGRPSNNTPPVQRPA